MLFFWFSLFSLVFLQINTEDFVTMLDIKNKIKPCFIRSQNGEHHPWCFVSNNLRNCFMSRPLLISLKTNL